MVKLHLSLCGLALSGIIGVFSQDPYICTTRELWTPAKKSWCCENKNLGCPASGMMQKTVEQVPHMTDCSSRERWSESKRAWCCANENLGCTVVHEAELQVAPRVDPAGSESPMYCYSREQWSDEKKEWCCEIKSLGCPPKASPETRLLETAPVSAPLVAPPGSSNMMYCFSREQWSDEKKAWCCALKGLGCPPPSKPSNSEVMAVTDKSVPSTASAPAGSERAMYCYSREQWSGEKSKWCCENKGLGCSSSPPRAKVEKTPEPVLPEVKEVDKTAPSAPRMLSLFRAAPNSATVVWVAPESHFDCEAHDYIVHYREFKRLKQKGGWLPVLRSDEAKGDPVQIMNGLKPDTQYQVRVKAVAGEALSAPIFRRFKTKGDKSIAKPSE